MPTELIAPLLIAIAVPTIIWLLCLRNNKSQTAAYAQAASIEYIRQLKNPPVQTHTVRNWFLGIVGTIIGLPVFLILVAITWPALPVLVGVCIICGCVSGFISESVANGIRSAR